MSKDAICKVWTAVGIATLFLAVNAILRVQGSDIFLPTINYEKAERYSTGVYGLIVTAIPYYLLIRMAKIFGRCHGDGTWSGSIPVAFGLEVDSEQRTGREFQRWVSVLFFVLPILARGLLLRKVFKATVYQDGVGEAVGPGIREHLGNPFPIGVVFSDDYRIGSLEHGVTYFPFWESWALLTVEALLWLYFLSLVRPFFNRFIRRRINWVSSRLKGPRGEDGCSCESTGK